jgi:acyl dehydratase
MAIKTGPAEGNPQLIADITTIEVGATASCELVIGDEQVQAFAGLSKDTNPLHMDNAVAEDLGFPGRVAHGALALSAISRLIGTELPGPGSLWLSQEVQFPNPVFIGNRIAARVTVEQVSKSVGIVVLRTEVVNLTTGAIVLRGSARVKILSRRAPPR